jgi:predicted PurR-regulated permease PerM
MSNGLNGKSTGGKCMKRGLAFKLTLGGILAVLIPVLVVGVTSTAKSSKALEETSKTHSIETAKSLASVAQLVLQEEIKIITELSMQKKGQTRLLRRLRS